MKAGEKGVHYLTKLHSTKMARGSVIPLSRCANAKLLQQLKNKSAISDTFIPLLRHVIIQGHRITHNMPLYYTVDQSKNMDGKHNNKMATLNYPTRSWFFFCLLRLGFLRNDLITSMTDPKLQTWR